MHLVQILLPGFGNDGDDPAARGLSRHGLDVFRAERFRSARKTCRHAPAVSGSQPSRRKLVLSIIPHPLGR